MGNSKTVITQKITSVALNKTGVNPVTTKEIIKVTDVHLPSDAPARMKTLRADNKKWYLTVVSHEDTNAPFALFCHTNSKENSITTSGAIEKLSTLAASKGILQEHIDKTIEKTKNDVNTSKLARVISLLLRHGVLVKNIVAELDTLEDIYVGSFLFQVKKFLSGYVQDGEGSEEKCTTCGGTLVFSEGCMMCRDCGNSKCG